jgi:hypothetical protein
MDLYLLFYIFVVIFVVSVIVHRTIMSEEDRKQKTEPPVQVQDERGHETLLTEFQKSNSHFDTPTIIGKQRNNRFCWESGTLLQDVPGCGSLCSYTSGKVKFQGDFQSMTHAEAHARCPAASLDKIWSKTADSSGIYAINYGTLSFDTAQSKVRPMIRLYDSTEPTTKYLVGVRAFDFTKKDYHFIRFMGGVREVQISNDDFENGTRQTSNSHRLRDEYSGSSIIAIPSTFRRIKSIKVLEEGYCYFNHGSGYVQLMDEDQNVLLEVRESTKMDHANDGYDRISLENRADESSMAIILYDHPQFEGLLKNKRSDDFFLSEDFELDKSVTSFDTELTIELKNVENVLLYD